METYVIADCPKVPEAPFYRRIAVLVDSGVDWVQVRAKSLEDRAVLEIAGRVRELTAGRTKLLVNGRADIAVGVSAEGVHLPAAGVPVEAARAVSSRLLVGRSCHTLEGCRRARDEGADYVLLGPLFPPRSKEGTGRIRSDDLIAAARLGLRVFALGGISRQTLPLFRGLPIAGIAAITLFMDDNPVSEVVQMVRDL